MLLRVLGSSGAEFPGHFPPSFLIDERILLDAGTITSRLTEREQYKIRHILITHSHLDHIKGIPFLAENVVIKNETGTIAVYGLRESLSALRRNLLNDQIWPDFTRISSGAKPVLELKSLRGMESVRIAGYKIQACRVSHTIPAVGYIIENPEGKVLLYSGDTGPTEKLWKTAKKVDTAIVEVSFPNRMLELAKKTGHLTPKLLSAELGKMKNLPGRVLVTHLKPQYIKEIKNEIGRIGYSQIGLLEDGAEYEL